jgi:hypothetical protein
LAGAILKVGLLLLQLEVHIVIFGLSSNTQTPCFEARKQHTNKLAKARGV